MQRRMNPEHKWNKSIIFRFILQGWKCACKRRSMWLTATWQPRPMDVAIMVKFTFSSCPTIDVWLAWIRAGVTVPSWSENIDGAFLQIIMKYFTSLINKVPFWNSSYHEPPKYKVLGRFKKEHWTKSVLHIKLPPPKVYFVPCMNPWL